MKSIKKISLVFFFAINCGLLHAQKQANNWIFGTKAGLTWNTLQIFEAKRLDDLTAVTLQRIPTAIHTSKFGNTNYMQAYNSSFALSDKDGNLQFYSDGAYAWNKSFIMFYNSGYGMSTTQGGVLMPIKPSSNYLSEFIAIIPGSGSNSGIDYMKFGYNYFSPGGAVSVARQKFANGIQNIGIGEVATIALKPNKKDMWVIAPRVYQNKPQLYAWLLNESGVNQNFFAPVVSEMVTLPTAFPSGYLQTGFIKLSPDSRHFIWGTKYGYTVLGKFDIETGEASDVKYINVNGYGVEFSRSGRYVYISALDGQVNVYETDELLSASDPTTVAPVYTYNGGTVGTALQLAPDGRIYQPINNTRSLIVVDKPEEAATDPKVCILEDILSDGGKVYLGLCNFSGSWFSSEIEGVEKCCAGGEEVYSYNYASGLGADNIAYTEWDFGDNNIVQVNISTTSLTGIVTCPHVYDKPGTYSIKVQSYTSLGQLLGESMEHTVTVNPCVIRVNPHIRVKLK